MTRPESRPLYGWQFVDGRLSWTVTPWTPPLTDSWGWTLTPDLVYFGYDTPCYAGDWLQAQKQADWREGMDGIWLA